MKLSSCFRLLTALLLASSWLIEAKGALKTRPSHAPEPKKVLFVAHFLVNTEVNQMLLVAEKLRERGHQVEFIVNELYQGKVQAQGFQVVDTTPNPMENPVSKANTKKAMDIALQSNSWSSYVGKFFPKIMAESASNFEPCLVTVQKHVSSNRPDVMVASMFSDCAIDVAKAHDVPTGIIYATPLGSLFGYEDHVAAPDALLWSSLDEHQNFWPRLRKVLSLVLLISVAMDMAAAANAIREKHGIAPIGHPLTNWGKAAVFHTWPLGLDLARPLRPLTFSTGFVVSEYQPPTNLSELDSSLVEILNTSPGGVVLAAFGTLAAPSPEIVAQIVQGLDAWARAQSQPAAAIYVMNDFSHDVDLPQMLPADSGVKIVKGWVNQRMILEHANTKAFITHGGQGSIAEAVYHQVPMLAIPIFGDQPSNGHRLQEAGIGLKLHFREEEVTASAVRDSLTNLTSIDAPYIANIERQYQISARAGGAGKIADVVEDMLLLGHLEHLIPVTERVPFPANSNSDLYLFLAVVVGIVVYSVYRVTIMVWKLVCSVVFGRAGSLKKKVA